MKNHENNRVAMSARMRGGRPEVLKAPLALLLAAALVAPLPFAAEAVIDAGEEQHLIFMREEEKLAGDVYTFFSLLYADEKVFAKISGSEDRHTIAVLRKLIKYGIDDPSTTDEPGIFTGEDYGDYFTEKYGELVTAGSSGKLNAFYAGALIEELDIHDIILCPAEIVALDNGVDEGECGLAYTDERAIQQTLTHLLEGSKDHLRAFVRNIERIISPALYEAQYLTQEEVDDILGR